MLKWASGFFSSLLVVPAFFAAGPNEGAVPKLMVDGTTALAARANLIVINPRPISPLQSPCFDLGENPQHSIH